MGRTLGTMITITTYGTWLRGDRRRWVDNGEVLPPNPQLEAADRKRMPHPPFLFDACDLHRVGRAIGESLRARCSVTILALTVQRWHVHVLIGESEIDIADVVKCAKDAVRWELRPHQPIWTTGYDKRFCFDVVTLRNRIAYVERHNLADGLPARPWPFITSLEST
ncbi:MAG: hypothetical protein WD648_12760 [Planctomycetaceae bacterium]